jgi:DNA invertase Pin-like site-specific DNA recombinase
MTTDAAIFLRVSTGHQHEENQLPALERFCKHHDYRIVQRYKVSGSAWNGGKPGGDYRRAVQQVMDDAYRGEFSVLVVWSIDRLSRGGIEDILRIVRELRERNVSLVSVQETWLNGRDATTDLLIAIAQWVAQYESERRAERTRIGMERARAEGKHIGRPLGAKDSKPRKTAGYKGQVNNPDGISKRSAS